jgi:peptidoglycan/LPS O-acetylase OafA/YrhL
MGQNDRQSPFRPDIEGLRGIAVLIVVLFHCGIPGFSGGFVGVDVFFVLSGYLITGLLVAEIRKTSRLSLLQFYARRARRLLPASALTLLVTLLIGALILAPQELVGAGRASRATALYVSNVFFATNAADYFAPDVKSNPMLHTWSLAVEEQFYAFWPLLILLGLRWWRSTKALVSVLSAVTMVSLGIGIWFTIDGGTFAFYQLPARAWEFGVGGLAVLLPRGTLKVSSDWWLALGWLGVLAILGSAHFILGDTRFPGWIALFPVAGTVAALVAGSEDPDRGIGAVLNSAPLQTLGTLSYSWYLWHWPFLVFSTALFPGASIAVKTTAAVASLAVAAVSHRFMENPIRFHPYLVRRPGLSLCFAAALTLGSLGVAYLSLWFASRLANEPVMKAITAATDDIARMPREQCVTLGQSSEVSTCFFGDMSSATNIVLFGDSHAIQWFNPLQRIAESRGWKLTTMVKSACPSVSFSPPRSGEGAKAACATWRSDALRKIIALRPSIVILGNATTYLGREEIVATGFSLNELRDGTKQTLQVLTTAGLRVAVMRDNPYFTYDIPTCLARSVRHRWYPGGSCGADRSAVLSAAVSESEMEAARGLPSVRFVDMTDRLCRKDVCFAIQGDAIVYRDNNHLTGNFADRLMPALEVELLLMLNLPR